MSGRFEYEMLKDAGGWDGELLALGGDPHPWQSSAYGDFLGAGARRARIFRDGKLAGMCLYGVDGAGAASWHFGPHAPGLNGGEYAEMFAGFLDFLKSRGVPAVVSGTGRIVCDEEFYAGAAGCFHEVGQTAYIDLSKGAEGILSSCDRSVAKNVRRCAEAGVEVAITDDAGAVEVYVELLRSHRERMGFEMPPFYCDAAAMKSFRREGARMEVAIASAGGTYLAGLGFAMFGGVAVEVGVGQSEDYSRMKLQAHDLIKVRAAERYAGMGLRYYDLAGVSRREDDEKEMNIRRFKMKFATGTAEFGVVRGEVFSQARYFAGRVAAKVARAARPGRRDI